MRSYKISMLYIICLLLTACANTGPWTAEQKDRLVPISVVQSKMSDKAFYDVSIKSYQMKRYSQEGLKERRGAVAMFVDIADAVQQGKFADRYGALLDMIKNKSQDKLDEQVASQLKSSIESISFFTGKIKDDSVAKIELTILDNGFIRGGADAGSTSAIDGLPLVYGAIGFLTVTDSFGKTILKERLVGRSDSMGDVPSLVANNFAMVNKMRQEVVASLIQQSKSIIERQTAEPK